MKNAIAIFDVGKTNKKLLLFDEQYQLVFERIARFNETEDEDGFPCENLDSLRSAVGDSLQEAINDQRFTVTAVNFSAYGASFVYLDDKGRETAPLYNYLKPYPPHLLQQFYNTYGGEETVARQTASPVLGNLNSGMQLYHIRHSNPALFSRIHTALHLPQYLSWLLSGDVCSDITSIGCHTNLWDFYKKDYHSWVAEEGILPKLAPIQPSNDVTSSMFAGKKLLIGRGLHDSSAALIPYLVNFKEPFLLISTGTWCITLNPFSHLNLTNDELKQDCLCYLQYTGQPVKASRLFAGNEHDEQSKRIAAHFNLDPGFYRNVGYDRNIVAALRKNSDETEVRLQQSAFRTRNLHDFSSASEAYHQLMIDIVAQQVLSTSLVMEGNRATRIFVDGGFSRNAIYMNLLAAAFAEMEVYAAFMPQASALGAALAIHDHWNAGLIPSNLIELKYYAARHALA